MVQSDPVCDYTHKWDLRFMEQANLEATYSKDPSTKVGCVIVDAKKRRVGGGFNGFARGVMDLPERYADRAIKYEMVVHAEVNAILNAVKSVEGCTLYCNFAPCPRCASVIIQAGIKRVVRAEHPSDERYKDSLQLAEQMFREAGIEFETLKQ